MPKLSTDGPLQLCVIQLDGVPQAISEYGKLWLPSEPLASEPEFSPALSAAAFFAAAAGTNAANILREIEEIGSTQTRHLLSEVLAFVDEHNADVVVLPEYVVPSSCLDVLVGFSRGRALVAGMGVVRNRAEAERLVADSDGRLNAEDLVGRNVSVLAENERVHLITKRYLSEHEVAEAGTGPVVIDVVLRGRSVRIGVAVCLDFLRSQDALLTQAPDIVCVPAFTGTTAPFVPSSPHDYVRMIANCVRHGGSTIVASSLRGSPFTDKRGVTPVGKGHAAVLMIEYDRFAQKPTSFVSTENRLRLRSEIIERSTENDVAVTVAGALADQSDSVAGSVSEDMAEQLTRWLKHLPTKGPLHDSLEEYRRALAQGMDDDALYTMLATHFTVTSTVDEATTRARQAKLIVRKIGDLMASGLETPPVGLLLDAHRGLANKLREETGIRRSDGEQWSFALRLGRYNSSRAVTTLPRQLNFLRAVNSLPPGAITVTYRLHSSSEAHSPDLRNFFDVIVSGSESIVQADQVEGQLRSMLVACWSVSRSDEVSSIPGSRHCLRITPDLANHSPTVRDDWSPIFDLIRTHDTPIVMDMRVTPAAPSRGGAATRGVDDDDVLRNTLASIPYMTVGDEAERRATAYFSLLRDMSREETKGLGMSLVLSSEKPIPMLLADTIRHEVFGTIPAVVEHVGAAVAYDEPVLFSPSELIRIFHPPYGSIQGRGLRKGIDEVIHYRGPDLPKMGLRLGTAQVAGPSMDRTADVLVDETARVRHMYVVGKTGTGKTNLLKELCRQDITSQRGLVVIDPHGDLVDYLTWHCQDRLDETVLLDFARPDYLPVINPLLLDIHDERSKNLHNTDFLRVLESRYYNEFTGPVFDDMVSQALETMFEPDFPVSRSLDLVETMYRNKAVRRLVAQSIGHNTVLRDRWNIFESMTEHERAERVVWMLSKFADLMPAGSRVRSALCSTRQSPLSVEKIVWNNGILLIKIPESTLGSSAAAFIGSLLLRRIQRAVFDYEQGTGNPVEDRLPFTLYIDEFQKFATAGIESLVAEARKFGCGLVLAHQNLEQLYAFSRFEGGRSRELLNAILGNVGTTVSFRVGPQDAESLADLLRTKKDSFDELPRFKALCRLTVDHDDTPCFTLTVDDSRRQLGIKAASARLHERMIDEGYWAPIEDVTAEIEGHLTQFEQGLKPFHKKAKAEADDQRDKLRQDLLSEPEKLMDKMATLEREHPEMGVPFLVQIMSDMVAFHLDDAPASVRQEVADVLIRVLLEHENEIDEKAATALLQPVMPDHIDQRQRSALQTGVVCMVNAGNLADDESPTDFMQTLATALDPLFAGFIGSEMDSSTRRTLLADLLAAGLNTPTARTIVDRSPAPVAQAATAWLDAYLRAIQSSPFGLFMEANQQATPAPPEPAPQPQPEPPDSRDGAGPVEVRSVQGPKDISEVDLIPPNHLDLGSIYVTVADDVDFRASANEAGVFEILTAQAGDNSMDLDLFAAPGGPLWPEVRALMAGHIAQDVPDVRHVTGPFGREIQFARNGDDAPIRIFGVDGPGWLLRVKQVGPAAWNGDDTLSSVLRGIIVNLPANGWARHARVPMRLKRPNNQGQAAEEPVERPETGEQAPEAAE